MDPSLNPFAPGAGSQPPELAGRDNIVSDATVALARIKGGRQARSQMLLGLRGVGKTVLLNRIAEIAANGGYETVMLEAPEDRSLAEMLVPPLRTLLFRLSRIDKAKDLARRALAVLRAFASAFKVKVGDIEFGVEAEVGTADSGSLETDLPDLLIAVAEAAKRADRAVAVFIDEVQYLSGSDLSGLIVAIHKMSQKALPFIVFGAGLPQLAALAGEARSYSERLFEYPAVGPLDAKAAASAIEVPLKREGVAIERAALGVMAQRTSGYPYFLQEWGHHAWNEARSSPIDATVVGRASSRALERLDKSFFRVRFDRLTPRERDYMRAMAELGPGPHRSGEIAAALHIEVTAAGPLRDGLIKKGMIYSPRHGDTAFTVPMFDEFMRREMPSWKPGTAASRHNEPRPGAAKSRKTRGRGRG